MARSPDTPDDDGDDDFLDEGLEDGDGEFGGVDIDEGFGRSGDEDEDSGDLEGGRANDDDDFEDFDMGAFGLAEDDQDNDGGEQGVSRALIGLIAASLVLIVLIASLVGWLMISDDPASSKEGQGTTQVIAALAPPPKAGAMPTSATAKHKPPAKPAVDDHPSGRAAADKPTKGKDDKTLGSADADKEPDSADADKKPASADADKKPASADADKKPASADADKKPASADADKKPASADAAKPGNGPPVIVKTFKEAKVEVAAVDPLLIDETTSGPLPKIAPDGRQPWQVYARPFKAPEGKTAKIAIVMAGLGLSKTQTLAAIQQLPGAVTLSFAPYARDLGDWIVQARAAGHEVLLELPMEPFDYPENDPGPHTLLTKLSNPDNLERLNWLLGRFPGYVGVTNFMGAKFTSNEKKLLPILQSVKERGLLYLDSKADSKSVAAHMAKELDLPIAVNNRFIDSEASRVSIDARLYELERISKSVSAAVGLAFPFPVTVERLAAWIATLEKKGFVLAPLTAVVNMQPIR